MPTKHILFALTLVTTMNAGAQDNRILILDALTGEIDTLTADTPTDTASAFLPHSTGSLPGYSPLVQTAYPENFPGPGLQRPPRAVLLYPLTDFPIRTSGALRRIFPDSTRHRCSGQLVGPRHVLTARHCVYEAHVWHQGPFEFFPVFDEGMPSVFGSVPVIRSYVAEQVFKDHALLELAEPIGEELGWMGLGFTTDPGFYDGPVFHKFSYPAVTLTWTGSVPYNGDTLYHMATPMVPYPAPPCVGVNGWTGVPGESGSGVWCMTGSGFHVTAVSSWSANYRHTLLDAGTFHQFRRIMDELHLSTPIARRHQRLELFPNPISTTARLAIPEEVHGPHDLLLLDAIGRVVLQRTFQGNDHILSRGSLAAGTYILRVQSSDGTIHSACLLID